jgi:hypothetical protein
MIGNNHQTNTIAVVRSRMMIRAQNVGSVVVGKPEGKNHLEDLGVDGRVIFKWNF